jgi:TonB family protein
MWKSFVRRTAFVSKRSCNSLRRHSYRPFCVKCTGVIVAFVLTASAQGLGQVPDDATPGLPQDPAGVLADLVLRYDYSTLKPGHLKATYQVYDNAGQPAEQGTYEYWWASKQVYRSSWTRGNATYTVWHTADGRVAYQGQSDSLSYFEHRLESAFRSPLTSAGEVDPAKFRLDRNGFTASSGSVVTCFNAVPTAVGEESAKPTTVAPFRNSLFHTYCINTRLGNLLGIYSFGNQVVKFNNFTRIEGRYLAHEVYFRENAHNILSAKIETIDALSPMDRALTPPQDAKFVKVDREQLAADIAAGLLVKKVGPVYPQDARDVHAQGKVVLQVIIGIDGRVRDLQLLSAPSASLASSAFWSVLQWQYKPYIRNGEPAEVETTVDVPYLPGQ